VAKITAAQRKDWRTLPLTDWNPLTFHAYFADMNREHYGIDEYLPTRNWGFEQRQLKVAIESHGAVTLKAAFDEMFRTYRPTREYPILTAGFAISYRLNAELARMRANQRRANPQPYVNDDGNLTADEVAAWL
jgi:hypothetical protein